MTQDHGAPSMSMLRTPRSEQGPLYHQLRDIIKSNIESGVWPPEFRLPNEFEVARRFGISRTTVRTALNELAREGLLRRRPGQGTFVVGPKLEADLARIQDLTTGLLAWRPGSTHRPIAQHVIPATASVARTLDLPPRTHVLEIVRLRLERGEPILLAKYHLPAKLVPGLEHEDLSGETLYPILATRYGIHIDRGRTWLEPTVGDEYEVKLLGIEAHAPCMLIRRLLEERGRPVVSTKMLLRGDKCKYVISWHQHQGEGVTAVPGRVRRSKVMS